MSRRLQMAIWPFVFALVIVVQGARAADPLPITIGWQPSMNGARFFVAKALGLFEKEGLDPSYIKFTAGPPFFAAFQSGSIDAGFMGFPPAVIMNAQGAPTKIIAVENDARGSEGLVVRNASGIKSFKDLAGKRIAVRRGTSADYAFNLALQKERMSPDQVQVVDLDVTALVPAFSRGEVDAGWFWEPWMGLMKRADGRVLALDRDYDALIGIVWLARTEVIDERKETVQRFLRAIDRTTEVIHNSPERAAKLIAPDLGLAEEHVLEVLAEGGIWPTFEQTMERGYELSIHPDDVAALKGLAGGMRDLAVFMHGLARIERVPDFSREIDPAPMKTYLQSK